MKLFNQKIFILYIDGYASYYHSTFGLFTKCHGNSIEFHTKEQIDKLIPLVWKEKKNFQIFEVTKFEVKESKEWN